VLLFYSGSDYYSVTDFRSGLRQIHRLFGITTQLFTAMKHLLIIRLSAMGDVAMTVPVVRALINQYTDVKVTVVSRPFFQPFFEHIPRVEFFAADVKNTYKGFGGIYRLYQDLKKLNIDAIAD